MKKKFLAAVTFLFAACVLLTAETVQSLKSKICVVREVYFEETNNFCRNVSGELNRNGFSNYSTYIDEYIGNTFGSGFVYVDKDGSNYVITNRHVVSRCEGASVEFTKEDGTVEKFENLKVIATDENLDIAVLAFTNNERPYKTGIVFASEPVYDGEDVWSAGYPGLGDEPLWQFGKGNVTNSSVKIKELLDPEISTLIQHSAPVDSGNSGGPLFRKNGDDYEVTGVNTWKYFYRQSTNIAIPASVVEKFITDSLAKKNAFNTEEDLKNRCASMKKLFNADEDVYSRDLSKYISYNFIKKSGSKAFVREMQSGSTNSRLNIKDAFFNNSPVEGLRYAVSSQVCKIFAEDDFIKNSEIKDPVKNADNTYKVIFSNESENVETVWLYEETGLTGVWRLASVEKTGSGNIKSKRTAENDSCAGHIIKRFDFELPYSLGLQFVMAPAVDDKNICGQQISFSAMVSIFEADVEYTKYDIGNIDANYFSVAAAFNVPMRFNWSWVLSPFVKAGFGLSTNQGFSTLSYAQAGIKFGYRPNDAFAVYGIAGWGIAGLNVNEPSVFCTMDENGYHSSGVFLGIGMGL